MPTTISLSQKYNLYTDCIDEYEYGPTYNVTDTQRDANWIGFLEHTTESLAYTKPIPYHSNTQIFV